MQTLYLCMVQRLIGLVIYRKAPTCFQFITFWLASTCFVSTCFVRASDCHHYWHLFLVLGFCANHEDCILLLQSTVTPVFTGISISVRSAKFNDGLFSCRRPLLGNSPLNFVTWRNLITNLWT